MAYSIPSTVVFTSDDVYLQYCDWVHQAPAAHLWIREFMSPTYCWPIIVGKCFQNKDFSYRSRCIIVTFFCGNGVSVDVLLQFLRLNGIIINEVKKRKVIDLYNYFDQDHPDGNLIRARYYYYDLVLQKILNLGGEERHVRYYDPDRPLSSLCYSRC